MIDTIALLLTYLYIADGSYAATIAHNFADLNGLAIEALDLVSVMYRLRDDENENAYHRQLAKALDNMGINTIYVSENRLNNMLSETDIYAQIAEYAIKTCTEINNLKTKADVKYNIIR